MLIFRKSVFMTLALWSVATTANASVISETFDVTASGFLSTDGITAPPTDPVSGNFTLTFDPTQSFSSGSVSASGLNIPLDYPLSYSFFGTSDPTMNTLYIGTDLGGGNINIASGQNSLLLILQNVAAAGLGFGGLEYTSASLPNPIFLTYTGTVTQTANMSAVPLPSGMKMFISALIAMGMLRFYRRKNSTTV